MLLSGERGVVGAPETGSSRSKSLSDADALGDESGRRVGKQPVGNGSAARPYRRKDACMATHFDLCGLCTRLEPSSMPTH